jgi:RimJ/RimL family protein N-acetyltransferase
VQQIMTTGGGVNRVEPMFTTERLLVRHFVPDDLDEFATLCADSRVMSGMGGVPLTRSEVERWIGVCEQKYADVGYGISAVFERESGRFVGYCGVVYAPDHDFDELIYVLNTAFWGKDYATEVSRAMLDYVFARSSLAQIWATIIPENLASARVVEKLGLRYVRTETYDDGGAVLYYVIDRKE